MRRCQVTPKGIAQAIHEAVTSLEFFAETTMNENPFASPENVGTTVKSSGWSRGKKYLLGCGIVVALWAVFLLPMTRRAGDAARRTQCRNNLKTIGLALWNYNNRYGSFPPAYTVDSGGRPLHSWRTLILPFIEEEVLYSSIDLSRPWDDPANKAAFEKQPNVFRCPSLGGRPGLTTYLGVAGEGCFFHGSTSRRESEIKDGTSQTLMVIETPEDRAVPWMAPQDADQQMVLGLTADSELSHAGGFYAVFADGSATFISAGLPASVRSAVMTIAGNDTLGEHEY